MKLGFVLILAVCAGLVLSYPSGADITAQESQPSLNAAQEISGKSTNANLNPVVISSDEGTLILHFLFTQKVLTPSTSQEDLNVLSDITSTASLEHGSTIPAIGRTATGTCPGGFGNPHIATELNQRSLIRVVIVLVVQFADQ